MSSQARDAFTTKVVDSGGVRLATRDYGGDGPPLVLMHGAGMTQGSLEPLAEHLRQRFRIVTFDFRGHGATQLAPWTLASAVADAVAVADAYGLGVPAVGGHSLGGMVAAAYGAQHPSCPGVVNIDGHGRGRVDQYVGYDEAEVRKWWAQQDRRLGMLTSGAVAVVLRGVLLALRQHVTSPETTRQVMRAADEMELFPLYERVACPLLVFNAIASENRRVMKLLIGDGQSLVDAYRQGLERDLAALTSQHEQIQAVTVDASHMLIRTHPELVARHIEAFLLPAT